VQCAREISKAHGYGFEGIVMAQLSGVYIDDINIIGKTFEQHLENLAREFERIIT